MKYTCFCPKVGNFRPASVGDSLAFFAANPCSCDPRGYQDPVPRVSHCKALPRSFRGNLECLPVMHHVLVQCFVSIPNIRERAMIFILCCCNYTGHNFATKLATEQWFNERSSVDQLASSWVRQISLGPSRLTATRIPSTVVLISASLTASISASLMASSLAFLMASSLAFLSSISSLAFLKSGGVMLNLVSLSRGLFRRGVIGVLGVGVTRTRKCARSAQIVFFAPHL